MQFFTVKIEHVDEEKKVEATEVKEEYGKLIVYNGGKKVGEFRKDIVEYWSLELE